MTLRRIDRLSQGGKLSADDSNALVDAARSAQYAEGGGDIDVDAGDFGLLIRDNRPRPVWAIITGGTDPYSWVAVDDTNPPTFPSQDATLNYVQKGSLLQSGGVYVGLPAYEINKNVNVTVGTKVQLWPSPRQDFYTFLFCCAGTSVCDPCPLLTTKPTSLYVGNPSAGCALTHCNTPARIVWQGSVSNQWIGDFACIGGPDCVCIDHVALRCVNNAYVVDITRNTQASGNVSHTGIPVTLSSCSPFCATFTVPADTVCAGATTYTISDDSTFASCGGSGSGSGSGGAITWSTVGKTKAANSGPTFSYSAAVPANSLLVVSVGHLVGTISGVTFNGVSMTSAVSSGAGPGLDSIWYLKVVAGVTANVVVTSSSAADYLISNATAVTGLVNFAPDVSQSGGGSGTGTDCRTGPFGPTTHAAEIWVGACLLFGEAGPTAAMGSWVGPFIDTGQDQTITGIPSVGTVTSMLLTTGVEVAAVIGSPNADVTGATYDAGVAVGVTFS